MAGTGYDMDIGVMFAGALMTFFAFAFNSGIIASSLNVDISLGYTAIFLVYGFSTFLAGFIYGDADYIRYFVDLSAFTGVLLFICGPILELELGQGLWFQFSLVALILMSLPSTAAVYFMREETTRKNNRPSRGIGQS